MDSACFCVASSAGLDFFAGFVGEAFVARVGEADCVAFCELVFEDAAAGDGESFELAAGGAALDGREAWHKPVPQAITRSSANMLPYFASSPTPAIVGKAGPGRYFFAGVSSCRLMVAFGRSSNWLSVLVLLFMPFFSAYTSKSVLLESSGKR